MNNSTDIHSLILKTMSDLLTGICDESTKDKDTNPIIIKPFLSKKIPSITIKTYLDRLIKYCKINDSTLVLILIYIDRICDFQKILINYFNIHKIILAALLIAIKYNEDEYFSNEFYAKVGGVKKKEINNLEYNFLCLIEFTLFVDEEVFNKYYNFLITCHEEDENEDNEDETGNEEDDGLYSESDKDNPNP